MFHVATMIATVLLLVFAAGLKRRLEAQAPAGSLLPAVAASGLGLVSVAGLMGAGLNTEFVFGVGDPDAKLVPEVGVFFAHWVGTIGWLWVGAGVAGVALAVAALKHAAAPRWIGWVSAVLGVITLLVRHLAAAVHGRDDGPDLAARHLPRVPRGRPRRRPDQRKHRESGGCS